MTNVHTCSSNHVMNTIAPMHRWRAAARSSEPSCLTGAGPPSLHRRSATLPHRSRVAPLRVSMSRPASPELLCRHRRRTTCGLSLTLHLPAHLIDVSLSFPSPRTTSFPTQVTPLAWFMSKLFDYEFFSTMLSVVK